MLVEIQEDNIDSRLIEQAVMHLKKGGVIIYPTDTVYSFGCDLYNKKALAQLAKLKDIKLSKSRFSIICHDLSSLSEYAKQIDRPTFKLMKDNLPGAFTFILTATNEIPRLFDNKRKEIGYRIPNNAIARAIVEQLGNPMATSSLLNDGDEIQEYLTDPYEIYERFDNEVDMIIDGGPGNLEGSTIIDCTSGSPEIVREGLGILR